MRLASFSGDPAAPPIGRLRLGIALAVVAGAAIGVALSPRTTVGQSLLLAGIAVLVVAPTAIAVAARRFDLFSPQTIFAFAFGAMFLARPVVMLYQNNFTCCSVGALANVRPGFTTMLAAALLGAIAFQLGYFVRRRPAETIEPSRKIDWDSRFVFRWAVGLGVAGTLLFGAYVLQGLSHQGLSAFTGRGINQSALVQSSTAYLYQGMYLLAPATLLLVGSAAFGHEKRGLKVAVAVLFGGLFVLSALPSGKRTALLVLLGALFVFYFLRRRTRPTLVASLVVVLIAFFAFSVVRDSRYASLRQQGIAQVVLQVFEHPATEVGRLFNGGETSMAPAFALETQIVPSRLGYRYGGATIGDFVTRPIPHLLWKGKPLAPEAALTSKVWPAEFKSGLAHPVYSVMGTFYFDLGLFGVALGMLVVGFGYRFVDRRLLRTHDEGLLVIVAAVLPLLVMGLRDSFPDTLLHFIFVIVPLAGVVEFARRRPIGRLEWKRRAVLLPIAIAVVLAVVFGGIEGMASSSNGAAVEQGAVQPPILVGSANPHGPEALPAVIASVRAALRGAPIPSPLVPSFYNLNAYGPPIGCDGANGAGVTSSSLCYLSGPTTPPRLTPTPGNKTLVLFGDGHGEMWIRPLLAMAGQDHWDVIPMFKAECPPAALYLSPAASGTSAECHTWYRWALRTIARLHPNAVFIGFLGVDSGANMSQEERGIASLLDREKKDAQHVVFMLDTPYLPNLRQPLDCLHKPGATLRTCTGTPLQSNGALAALARAHHVGVIDPLGWFCYKALCPLAIGHTIAFANYGFVSGVYATALSPPFRAAFRAALRAK